MEYLLIQRSSKYLTSHKVQIQSDGPLSFNLSHTAAFHNPGDGEEIVNIWFYALLQLYLVGLSCVEEALLTVFVLNHYVCVYLISSNKSIHEFIPNVVCFFLSTVCMLLKQQKDISLSSALLFLVICYI